MKRAYRAPEYIDEAATPTEDVWAREQARYREKDASGRVGGAGSVSIPCRAYSALCAVELDRPALYWGGVFVWIAGLAVVGGLVTGVWMVGVAVVAAGLAPPLLRGLWRSASRSA